MKKTLIAAALLTAAIGAAAPAHAKGEWWDTRSFGQALCSTVEVGGRDWAVNYAIGDYNGTAAGARMVDAVINKYCPQYAD